MPVQPTGAQAATSNKFTWKITNFTELTENKYYSRPFTIGDNNWRILVYPKGCYTTDHLSLYLSVADSANLPHGWKRFVKYSLAVVNQRTTDSSKKFEASSNFCTTQPGWGFRSMVSLVELRDDGFLMNDTIIIEAGVNVPEVRPVDASLEMLDSYFSSLEQFISGVSTMPAYLRSPSDARSPTSNEVKKAKQSLKECLSDPFKLNMKDKLAEALSTLSSAEVGLSAGQLISVRAFWARFGDFTSDFLILDQDNAEFELQKLLKDQKFLEMKKCHETHIVFKKLSEEIKKEEDECKRKMDEITKEEEECKRKMEGICVKKAKLESKWEVLLAESQEAKSKYKEHEKKAKDAEEKKRVAEERMSRSTTAWSNLKVEFA